MKATDFKTFQKFLSRNKLYTFVCVFGFSVSLMFVILLSVYVKQQLSVDDFQEKKDRIFLITNDIDAGFANPVTEYIKDKCPEVESYSRIFTRQVIIGEKGNDRVKTTALFADPAFFTIFSFRLIEGDPFQVLAMEKTTVISRSFAVKRFGDRNPVGSVVFIDNIAHTITGVMEDMPRNTVLPKTDIVINYASIVPYCFPEVLSAWWASGYEMFFLEKEGTDLTSKAPVLLDLFKKEYNFYKDDGYYKDFKFTPLKEVYFNDYSYTSLDLQANSRTLIAVYTGIAILILVIAILNYINMTVAQAGFRGKEAAIKKLMGGSRKELIAQLLAESLLMTSFAFIAGLFMAFLAEPFFNNVLSAELDLASAFTPGIIGLAIAFVALVSFVSGILPALIISGFEPIEAVKGTFSRKVKASYSKALIVFQYTVAILLLTCSLFIIKQSKFLINHETGFNKECILVMENVLETKRLEGFREKLHAVPGVEMVSFAMGTPLNKGNNMSFELDGKQFSFQEFAVDSIFFDIFDITVEPTGILATDKTYWVNRNGYNALRPDPETFAANFGGNGRRQIAGIASNFNIQSLHNPIGLIRIRKLQKEERPWDIIVKISPGADLAKITDLIRKTYSDYNGGEFFESRFVDETVRQWYDKERKMSAIMSAFTILTIIIMVMGVFAMSLYMIRQKEKEIGLRKVNGATENEILVMLNADSLVRVLIAFAVACPVAYFIMRRWLENFAYKITLNWWVFAAAGIAVLMLTLLSVSGMTWKAARTNPVDSLKGD